MEQRILLLALRGRDADVLQQLLADTGRNCQICQDATELAEQLAMSASTALITEESLSEVADAPLINWVEQQPAWSDFPFILLATKRSGRRPEAASETVRKLGNVVVLERPIHAETLVSAVKSAMRVRLRQYEARQRLEDLEVAEQRLTKLNHQLKTRVDDQRSEIERLWMLSEDLLARASFNGEMIAVNPAWTTTLGYSEHQLLTQPYSNIIDPEDLPATFSALSGMQITGQPTRFENAVLAADGKYKPIGWTVSPEPDGIHFIAVGRDLTSEKERELAFTHAQEQLRQAQKMEAVGQLTGGIAHDFNNLLQGITGSLDIVQRRIAQNRTDDIDRFISGAVTSAQRAAALTHRLLAFSRRQPLDARAFAANPLIESMAELLRRTIGEHITLELKLVDDLWPTLCDANQLENALLNLAINARDAMPDGGQLTIKTENMRCGNPELFGMEIEPGDYISIAVTDSGVGMAPDVMARAFDPFFTTKGIGQGTGLGLSMIYGFVRQSGGDVKIDSIIHLGTSITLFLPRHKGGIQIQDAKPDLSDKNISNDGEVVVVIEDEPVVRELIVDVLVGLGYRALEAADGPSGLALINATERIDLLVTDIGLPGLNGRQVADAARSIRPDLKVLFMTGYADAAVAAKGFMETGMSMMTKPFAMEDLASRIRHSIEND